MIRLNNYNCIIICILFAYTNSCWAEDINIFGVRPAISQTGRITDVIDYNLFISTRANLTDRTVDGIKTPARDMNFYVGSSIIYKYSPQLNFSLSYAYQRANPFSEDFSNEHRIFQQAVYSMPVLTGNFYQRARIEQRFIINNQNQAAPMATRFRYMVGYNLPLQGKRLELQEFYLNTYNEFFFSTSGRRNAVYSENRLYAGIGYNTKNSGNIEIGPLLITTVNNTKGQLRNFLLLQVLWSTNFDFFR